MVVFARCVQYLQHPHADGNAFEKARSVCVFSNGELAHGFVEHLKASKEIKYGNFTKMHEK